MLANPAYLRVFFSDLLRVAPYCAPGGVRMVSRVHKLRVAISFAIRFRAWDMMRHLEQQNTKQHSCGIATCRSSAAQSTARCLVLHPGTIRSRVVLRREVRPEDERDGERRGTVYGGQQPVLPRGIHPAKEEALREVDGAVQQAHDKHASSRVDVYPTDNDRVGHSQEHERREGQPILGRSWHKERR